MVKFVRGLSIKILGIKKFHKSAYVTLYSHL